MPTKVQVLRRVLYPRSRIVVDAPDEKVGAEIYGRIGYSAERLDDLVKRGLI